MRYLLLCITTLLLPACLSINAEKQTQSGPALYDFGMSSSAKDAMTNLLAIDDISSNDALNNNRIRYRLNYKDPAQVLTYSQSRWTTTPAQLLKHQLLAISKTSDRPLQNCSLKLELETFDHIFESPTKSSVIVQINVTLIEKKSRKMLMSTMIEESAASASNDSKGGVAALTKASDAALQKTITWSNHAAESMPNCQ